MKHEYRVGKNKNGQWFVTRNNSLVIPIGDVIAEFMRDMMGLPIGEELEVDEAYEKYNDIKPVECMCHKRLFTDAYKLGKAAK